LNSREKDNSRRPQNVEEGTTELEKYFRKTKTIPYLYYLPLSEEEVKGKRQNLNKKIQ